MKEGTVLKAFALSRQRIPELALTLMLAGILMPTALYSFHLQSPSPAELLVAVSIALFAAVLFLWIMDATGLMPFRAPWISKAVYGAAITSILGTSVAVYKDFFAADKYPFTGAWQATITNNNDPTHPTEFPILLSFSESGQRYWGYSALIANSTDGKTLVWAEVVEVSPKDGTATVRLHFGDGHQQLIRWAVTTRNKGRWLDSKQPSFNISLEMHRP